MAETGTDRGNLFIDGEGLSVRIIWLEVDLHDSDPNKLQPDHATCIVWKGKATIYLLAAQ